MAERQQQSERLWSFPEGMLGPDDSLKGFHVEASDGPSGTVAWASYSPGESYLVITLSRHLHKRHHVVPAAAVERVSTKDGTVWLHVPRAQVEEAPEQHDPPAPLEPVMLNVIQGATATWVLGVR
jgi:hypothetical protein